MLSEENGEATSPFKGIFTTVYFLLYLILNIIYIYIIKLNWSHFLSHGRKSIFSKNNIKKKNILFFIPIQSIVFGIKNNFPTNIKEKIHTTTGIGQKSRIRKY